ncbi:MAG: hypothetical protein WC813_02130 [Patescibacteria group bacterium]|jgi:Kef-type K+ transport system membrane component KefB
MAGDDVRKYYVFALRAFADVLGTILVPAVAAVVIKNAFHLPTTIFLALLVAAFILTALVLAKKISQYGRSFQQLNRSQDELRRSGS